MSGRGSKGSSWLDRVAQLLAHPQQALKNRPTRKLAAEQLERRTVLSGTPLAAEETESSPSLEEYLAQEHAMGPAAPSESSLVAANEGDMSHSTDAPALADEYFDNYAGQGEGGGEGEGSGSGSGGGSGSGSGSGGGSGSGSGEGSGSGSGEGSGSGQGSGCGGSNEAPEIESFWFEYQGDTIILHGRVSNDGGYGGMTITFGDLINVTITPNQYGDFTLSTSRPEDAGNISVTAKDASGLTSEPSYVEVYPS